MVSFAYFHKVTIKNCFETNMPYVLIVTMKSFKLNGAFSNQNFKFRVKTCATIMQHFWLSFIEAESFWWFYNIVN